MSDALVLRPADLASRRERGWICSTWVRSFGAHRAGVVRSVYGHEQGRLVDKVLASPHVRIAVLSSEDSPTAVHAWACGEPGGPLHYVYVPSDLRHNGLAKRVITYVLGSYPAHVDITHPWPWASERFRFNWYFLTRLEEAA